MTTATSERIGEVEVLRQLAGFIHKVVRLSADGLTQQESLLQPQPQGNCLNWVLGHLLCVYNNVLRMLEQEPVMAGKNLKRYDRGAPGLHDPGEALDLKEMLAAWDEASERVDAGLQTLTVEILDAPAPFSPTKNPHETRRSLLSTLLFHQAYHAGQMGMLRRMAGKEGALG